MKKVSRPAFTLPYGRIALLALLAGLAISALRGCAAARQEEAEAPVIAVFSEDTGEASPMPLEEYIVCVVGAEMPASFPLEALKAQAVAARTYAVRRMSAYGGSPCGRGGGEICTDSGCCQAFKTVETLKERWGDDAKRNYDKVREAVYSTAAEVAVYGGKPIEALYHSAAGGRTEDAQNVFSQALPYLVGVDSPGEEASERFHEETRLSPKAFVSAVNGRWKGAGLRKSKLDKQVKILSRYESGQVKSIRLGGATVSGRDVRKLFGLNSANFTLDIGDDVSIVTTGYGHGVGMSQYGARAMALEGRGYREILAHYYSGVVVAPMEALK